MILIKIYFASTLISWYLAPRVVHYFEKNQIIIFCLILIGVFQATPFILYKIGYAPDLGSESLVLFLSFFIFVTGTFSLLSLMIRESMVPDIIDQVQSNSSLRQDATISSVTSFCAKCMTGLGQFFSMFALWLIGFPEGNIEPSNAQTELLALFQGPLVFLLFLIPVTIFFKYEIDRKTHRQIIRNLKTQEP